MTERPPAEAISTARDLNQTLKGLRGDLSRLKRSRKIDRLILAVLVLLALGLGANSVRVSRADAVAQSGHDSSVAACRASNVTRVKEIALWNHLASEAKPTPGETKRQIAENKRAVAAFLAYVAKTFAPRDCNSLYKLGR
jgi:hypothetical protein